MLRIPGARRRLCDGLSRRDFLQVGALGGVGLSMPTLLEAAAGGAQDSGDLSFGKAKRCVLLFLMGGPPQHDTWDLKPEAPVEIRGELGPIPTNVPGVQISELFPLLSRQADKYCLVRSVTHGDTVHTSAGYTMLTGDYHRTPNTTATSMIRVTPEDHPHLGSIVAKLRGRSGPVPPFVAIPEVIKDAAVNEVPGQRAGLLGQPYDPFLIEANEEKTGFRFAQVEMPAGVTFGRLTDRRTLLAELDRRLGGSDPDGQFAGLGAFQRQAFEMIGSAEVRRAFDLDREPARAREAYGSHLFGQGCLLARRLLEAGVLLTTVYWHYEGPDDSPVWDTHENNFRHLRERLMPPTDQAVSALLEDLSQRGLLEDTLVICMGEFGRSPKVNSKAGRDHWPGVQSIMLAGAGLPGGSIYGASDQHGAYPLDHPVTPPDLFATFLHLLGIRPDALLHDYQGRPLRATRGQVVRGLLG